LRWTFFVMKTLFIEAQDCTRLAIHIFEPKISHNKVLLINSATGVKQQIYFSFAQFFVDQGFTVITYDYRGIGLSKPIIMKGYKASMRVWGNQDFKTLTDFIKINYHDYRKYCLGHSVGALILGMNADAKIFDQFIFVGTQNSYVGDLKFKTKIEAYLGFGIAQPLTTQLLGYFPAHWFGLGESLPAGCAFDWRSLILNKKSTNKLLEKTENYALQLDQNVLVLWAEDDNWLTEKGVKKLLVDTYANMKPIFRLVKTSESDKGEIGHVNFFRSYNQKLWNIILQELI